jgi:hypothetical protein
MTAPRLPDFTAAEHSMPLLAFSKVMPGWLMVLLLVIAVVAVVIDYFRDRRGDD